MKQKETPIQQEHLVDRSDIKESVYQQLKQMIMKRDLTPNERIDAVELAERFGISRTPVRDALNRLGDEGFITTVPRQGIYVKGLYRSDLIELFQYREMVELYALDVGFAQVRLAADEAGRVLERFETLLDPHKYDGNEVMVEDIKLHKLIVRSTGNQKIIDSYEKLNGHVQTARAYYLQDLQRITNAHREHLLIVEAIIAGDKDQAKRHLKTHLDHTLAHLLTIIEISKVF